MASVTAEDIGVAAGGVASGEGQLTDAQISTLSDMVLAFSQQMCGVDLYPYEQEFGWRIIHSMLSEDGEEVTALFSRQSGKTETVAVVVAGLMVLLPVLAKAIPQDDRIAKYRDGVWCGVYTPNYDTSGILGKRLKARLYSNSAKLAMLDPDIDMDLAGEYENLKLPNGSYVFCGTASPQAAIEGKTWHLILMDETQDIASSVIRASIHPMAAATAGTLVKVGTPSTVKGDFFEACRRNRRSDLVTGKARSRYRCHFEFDYTVAQRYNPRYRKYVVKEIERLGEDSDEFKMKYRLIWLLERGMYVNPEMFRECGVTEGDSKLTAMVGRGKNKTKVVFPRSNNVITWDPLNSGICASWDVGRENSTVVTVGRVFWEGGVDFAGEMRYPIHVYNWLELQGDDHEQQWPQVLEFLGNYSVEKVIVDATGKGDPVFSRLEAELDQKRIQVLPFVFSTQSKDVGYKVLHQELTNRRLTYPAGKRAASLKKWQRFVGQFEDLEKSWRGGTLVVNKAKDSKMARDDFPDSLMMLCYLVNVRGTMEVEVGANPFVGRMADTIANMASSASAWYRNRANTVVRPARPTRPSHRGRFD